ncbi:GrpB family protein [Brevundimonas sp. NPDC090276]|uniref:GrpB family protein n=1 Tax=Brevundimonas sp. NPDC090276 TaxID=3363956 RepID=UPI00383BE1F2
MKPASVRLVPHDPLWSEQARAEALALAAALGSNLLTVHHIGSTAIPGIVAKPVIDLMPVVASLAAFDRQRQAMESLGYRWRGEGGLADRRYCTRSNPATGRRLIQAHAYEDGGAAIARHLAFRDYLREHPDIAATYQGEKMRCRDLCPADKSAYSDCKADWIRRIEAEALIWAERRLG